MAVNRYDSPAQDNYFNTYVPLPYEQIMAGVAARQNQVDKQQALLEKTYEDTQNLRYIPGTKDEQYVRDYLGNVSNLVSKYIGADLSDPVVKNKMRSEFMGMTNRQNIQNIQDSWANWQMNNKVRAQKIADGTYDPYFDEDPAKNPQFSSLQNGVYNYITPGRVNEQEVADKYFQTAEIQKGKYLGDQGDFMIHGANENMTNDIADRKFQDFMAQPGIPQFINKLADQSGLDKNDPAVRQQIAQTYLRERGKAWTWNDRQAMPSYMVDERKKKLEFGNTSQGQTIRSVANFDPYGIGKLEFNDKGDVTSPEIKTDYVNLLKPGEKALLDVSNLTSVDEIKRQQRIDEGKAKLNYIREQVPALQGLNDKDTYSAYKDLIKDGKAFPDLPKIDITGVARKGMAEYLANSIADRDLQIVDDFGTTDLRNANDNSDGSPLRDLGYTAQTLSSELLKAASGDPKATVKIDGLAQNGARPGMIIVDALDLSKKGGSKGKVRKLYITTNQETEAIMSPAKEIYENIRLFKPGVTPVGADANGNVVAARVIPNAYKNKNTNKWEYTYSLQEGHVVNGEFIPALDSKGNPKETTMERIKAMQLRQLEHSGYINTSFNATNPSDQGF
jgi:hypothetical protein